MFKLARSSALVTAAGVLAPWVAAQETCTFTIDQAASNFTWDFVTSLGTFGGNPNNEFQLSGTVGLDLANEGDPASTLRFRSGQAAVTPDISGVSPAPPFPPISQVDFIGLVFTFESTVMQSEAVPGEFSGELLLVATSGTVLVTVLGLPELTLDWTDTVVPFQTTGTLTQAGEELVLDVPILSVLNLDDEGGLFTAELTLSGHLRATLPADADCGKTLITDVDAVSLSGGGTQTMYLDAGADAAGQLYWVFGSASGTFPGLPGPPAVPLNFDSYLIFTLTNPNTLVANSLSILDAEGQSVAAISLAAGTDPSLAGLVLNHAHVLYGPGLQPLEASNAAPLLLAP